MEGFYNGDHRQMTRERGLLLTEPEQGAIQNLFEMLDGEWDGPNLVLDDFQQTTVELARQALGL